MKPRLAENANELYNKFKELCASGVVDEGKTIYPVIHNFYGLFTIKNNKMLKIVGVGTIPASNKEIYDIHDDLENDSLTISLLNRWGNKEGCKLGKTLHSPSGNAWKKFYTEF